MRQKEGIREFHVLSVGEDENYSTTVCIAGDSEGYYSEELALISAKNIAKTGRPVYIAKIIKHVVPSEPSVSEYK